MIPEAATQTVVSSDPVVTPGGGGEEEEEAPGAGEDQPPAAVAAPGEDATGSYNQLLASGLAAGGLDPSAIPQVRAG